MNLLDYIKKYHNLDLFIALLDEMNFSDEEIITKLSISKMTIYNAKERLQPLMTALATIDHKLPQYGNPDVNTIVDTFKERFGTTKTSKNDRFAAKRLAAKHGADNVARVIIALGDSVGDTYAPSVNSVQQLEEKWVSVGKFLNNKSSDNMVVL